MPAAGNVSPGIIVPISVDLSYPSIDGNNGSANRIVKTHQFCAITERCFYLYVRKHLRYALHHLLQPYAKAAGVPGIAPYDLRRSCAKMCRAAGGELEQIQLLLGHASVQTTER